MIFCFLEILAALEQMDLLQKQQARNLRSIQSAVPSLLDVDTLKEDNDKLQTKLDKVSRNLQQTEEQKAKIKEATEKLQSKLKGANATALQEFMQSIEELTAPLPEVKEEEFEKKEEPEENAYGDIEMRGEYDNGDSSPQIEIIASAD